MKVLYFVSDSGRRPVEEFYDSLNIRSKRKFINVIEMLEVFGRELAMPHSKYIGDDIFELRFESLEGSVRVLYFFFDGDRTVLTNGFIKKSNKTPKNEKQIAIERRTVYFK